MLQYVGFQNVCVSQNLVGCFGCSKCKGFSVSFSVPSATLL